MAAILLPYRTLENQSAMTDAYNLDRRSGIKPLFDVLQTSVLSLDERRINGGNDGIRTHDLFRDRELRTASPLHFRKLAARKFGCGGRSQTGILSINSRAHYQLCYTTPENCSSCISL